jgi:hypothetical protein
MADLEMKKEQTLNKTMIYKSKGKTDWKILFEYVNIISIVFGRI